MNHGFHIADQNNGVWDRETIYPTKEAAQAAIDELVEEHVQDDAASLAEKAADEDSLWRAHPADDDYEYLARISDGEDPIEVARERGQAFFYIVAVEDETAVESAGS